MKERSENFGFISACVTILSRGVGELMIFLSRTPRRLS